MGWVPTARLEVLHVAVRLLPAPVSATAVQPAIALPLSVKPTLPVGLVPFTVAVKVTVAPAGAGLSELASVVVVGLTPPAANTAAPASTMPAPQIATSCNPEPFPWETAVPSSAGST